MADDVIVCASELATNAAIHSRSASPGGTFTVHAEVASGDYAWIEVHDGGGPWVPTTPDPLRGRGLDIVGALATDWGIDGDDRARIVWARFDWPGA
jgi:anti-sigma regulatory factor (Ser/Thr protein kinase)